MNEVRVTNTKHLPDHLVSTRWAAQPGGGRIILGPLTSIGCEKCVPPTPSGELPGGGRGGRRQQDHQSWPRGGG